MPMARQLYHACIQLSCPDPILAPAVHPVEGDYLRNVDIEPFVAYPAVGIITEAKVLLFLK